MPAPTMMKVLTSVMRCAQQGSGAGFRLWRTEASGAPVRNLPALYRPRQARSSPLYGLLESHYEEVKGQWDERFASRCGSWRGACEDAAYAFLDCGIHERGFARVRCDSCRSELLVAFSCQRRGLCPSCAAKRGALFGVLLGEEVLAEVGHLLWTFTIPKMLRPYFLHHRELLGRLCQAGWEVVRDLMVTATGDRHLQPGMVSVIQTAGDLLGWHPHIHAIASRGGWDRQGRWVPVPLVDTVAAERLFRHQVIALLRDEGLLSEERIALLLSWRNSGFSVHAGVTVAAGDTAAIERLDRYLLRSPVAVERMQRDAASGEVVYRPRHVSGPGAVERFAAADFLALALQHVPALRLHQVRYYGRYSNAARARRAAAEEHVAETDSLAPSKTSGPDASPADPAADDTAADQTAQRRHRRRLWAQLLRRVYEVDPLTCRHCGGPMRVVAFIHEPAAIRKILAHLERHGGHRYPSRDPPVNLTTPTPLLPETPDSLALLPGSEEARVPLPPHPAILPSRPHHGLSVAPQHPAGAASPGVPLTPPPQRGRSRAAGRWYPRARKGIPLSLYPYPSIPYLGS